MPAERGAGGPGQMRMTGTYWLLLLTTEREVFGSRRGQRLGRLCEVLEQILAQHLPEAPGRPEEVAPAD
ncbi:hypothetical protein ACIP3A_30515 [Streptomyces tricolor]|uniref:hypothetical protein n=1 Tax=Streptomyces tricolor TaxID=68277 RepID=UPI0037F606AE